MKNVIKCEKCVAHLRELAVELFGVAAQYGEFHDMGQINMVTIYMRGYHARGHRNDTP